MLPASRSSTTICLFRRAGFIGYDTYVATSVPPTLPNAVLMASNLFVDIINVFLRILNILGRRD